MCLVLLALFLELLLELFLELPGEPLDRVLRTSLFLLDGLEQLDLEGANLVHISRQTKITTDEGEKHGKKKISNAISVGPEATVDLNTTAEGEEERRTTAVDKFKLGVGEGGIDIGESSQDCWTALWIVVLLIIDSGVVVGWQDAG